MVRVIEKPLHPGWVYPCTVEEIQQQLLTFPPADLDGLAMVCLCPATRRELKEWGLYGAYYRTRAKIDLCGWPAALTDKFPKEWKRHHIDPQLVVQRSFGMQVEQIGRRWYCRWAREDWRCYVLEHVLPHEIGHHVGWVRNENLSEGFADDYALRYLQSLNSGADALDPQNKEFERPHDFAIFPEKRSAKSPSRSDKGYLNLPRRS
jgi:hypothetical protein